MVEFYIDLNAFTLTLIVAFVLLFFCSVYTKFYVLESKQFPPIVSGWIPWLGCAVNFGKDPLKLIKLKTQMLGSVFTLKVAGERMTFLTDPKLYHLFFRSKDVDFQEAMKPVVKKVAGINGNSFSDNHTKLHDVVKGKLATTNLHLLLPALHNTFQNNMILPDGAESLRTDLVVFVRQTMYKSVLETLFGPKLCDPKNKTQYDEFEKHFLEFDENFELGSKLPSFLLKKWTKSKHWLLQLFQNVIPKVDVNGKTDDKNLLESVVSEVEGYAAPNWIMLLCWAALANAIPITFWTLAYIISHPDVEKKVIKEINELQNSDMVNESILHKMPYTRCCVFESIRLHSPGVIARRVTREFHARGYTIPAGDLLLVSPFWSHRNPQVFPQPEQFIPERWDKIGLDMSSLPEAFIAFGGGRYQCPGRWFALMEIHLYVCMFFSKYKCTLKSSVPDFCKLHLVGTQQPLTPCQVEIALASS